MQQKSGRPSKLDEDQKEELEKLLNENREASASKIKAEWEKTCPFPLSVSSIEKVCRQLEYRKKSGKQKPILRQISTMVVMVDKILPVSYPYFQISNKLYSCLELGS